MGACNDPLTASQEAVALDANAPDLFGVDFGFWEPTVAAVGDLVWYDTNQDGIQDGGEPGLPDITIHLHDNATCQGSPFATDMTDSNGFYGIGGIAPGTYCLDFADGIPVGWTASPADQGPDDAVDSDVDPSTHMIQNLNLPSGDDTQDAGIFVRGEIGNQVWCDQDGDGAFDLSEGVGAVTISLYADTDCNSQPEGLMDSAESTADGGYYFSNLHTGPPGGPPVCYVIQVDVGDMGACDQAITPTSHAVPLQANDPAWYDADFGFRLTPALSLGDLVWFDTDHDGIQEAGEPGLQGTRVELFANAGCQGSPAAADTTDGAGLYGFAGLSPGTYCLSFRDGIPAGMYISAPHNGSDDTVDSDLQQSTRLIDNITLSADDPTRDVGLHAYGAIGGYVFCDANASGTFDGSEGVDGVTVTLFDDDDCNTSAGSSRATRNTVSGGWYAFDPVFVGPPGGPPLCYVVRVDVGDMGACNVAISSTERYVGLTFDNPQSPANHVGFVELPHAVTRVYVPLILRKQATP
jgi:hypothetical protein